MGAQTLISGFSRGTKKGGGQCAEQGIDLLGAGRQHQGAFCDILRRFAPARIFVFRAGAAKIGYTFDDWCTVCSAHFLGVPEKRLAIQRIEKFSAASTETSTRWGKSANLVGRSSCRRRAKVGRPPCFGLI